MKYQAISRDYNGTTVILQTSNTLEEAIARIKQEVTSANFENALTTDSKFKSIEAFFPVLIGKSGQEKTNVVYAGQMNGGDQQIYKIAANKDPQIASLDGDVKFYIGKNEGKDYYLENHKGELITSFDAEGLQDKTHYFVKVIK